MDKTDNIVKATDRVKLADVADAAGVAISTVSRVFSDPARVNFQTIEHVREVAQRLGYRPRPQKPTPASSPRRAHAPEQNRQLHEGMFALVVSDTADGISSQILKGAQQAAMESDHVVSVIETGKSAAWTATMLDHLRDSADGIILATDQLSAEDILQLQRKLPVVALNRPVENVPSVVPDPLLGVSRALHMLRRYGHRSIVYVAASHRWSDQSRWTCLHDVAIRMGFTIRRIGPVNPSVEGGYQAALALENMMPDTVVTYNDLIAAGVVLRLTADGVQVPGDVSVMGFDNTLIAPVVTPSITAIRIPRAIMGQAAVNILLGRSVPYTPNPQDAQLRRQLAEYGVTGEQFEPNVTAIDTSLIIRNSVGDTHIEAVRRARTERGTRFSME